MSRGVVTGDVSRADEAWNARVQAAGDGAGVDTNTVARASSLPDSAGEMLEADLWDVDEAMHVFGSLLASYTGITISGTVGDVLLSMAKHAAAIGVLTERQRWDGGGKSVREAVLEGQMREMAVVVDGALNGGDLEDMADALTVIRRRMEGVLDGS